MRVPMRSLTSMLAVSVVSLLAGACGDDGGGGGGTADDTATGPGTGTGMDDGGDDGQTNAGPTSADTTGGTLPDPDSGGDDMTDPTGMVDDSTGGAVVEDVSFRFNSMTLVDPHMFAFGLDITGQVNDQFNNGLNMDDPMDEDDFLDLGLVLNFQPLDIADGASGDVDFANADCLAPDGAMCGLQVGSMPFPSTYTNIGGGACLAADPTHLNPEYDMPAGPTGDASGACFTTMATDIELVTSSVTIPLAMAEVSAKYVGTGNLVQGLVRGFITEEVAMTTNVMADPVNGPLIDFLEEGDRDEGGTGWWFYIQFTAEATTWTGG